MLSSSIKLRRLSRDVLLTTEHADTEVLVGDLEVVPRRRIPYRGVVLEEMDLEAVGWSRVRFRESGPRGARLCSRPPFAAIFRAMLRPLRDAPRGRLSGRVQLP
jgi:hypothetical protein